MAEENLYKWTDNCCVSGVAKCDTDVLNDCLMHLKYDNENPNILKTNQITNCLLEVPQNIKLELNDGILTLKAGSEVIVPNGFEEDGTTPKFDYVTIESDLSVDLADTRTFVLTYVPSLKMPNVVDINDVPPSYNGNQYALVYNPSINKVSRTSDYAVTWQDESFPIAIYTTANNTITGIQQVFNGMGYIGSTVWVDKGVKCLLPNGRNEDGSLKNIEITTSNVFTQTATWASDNIIFSINYDGIGRWGGNDVYYNEYDNFNYFNDSKIPHCFIGTFAYSNGITSFQPKQPFRAVDYNEFTNIPHIVDTYVNGTSWYRIYSDGWCEQGGATESGTTHIITFLKPFRDTNYTAVSSCTVWVSASRWQGHLERTSNTQMTLASYDAGAKSWYACGYIN
jgi:hypothetical protein